MVTSWHFRFGFLLVLIVSASAGGVRCATVLTCDETSLRAAASGGGTITFGCDGTIVLGSTLVISNDTVLRPRESVDERSCLERGQTHIEPRPGDNFAPARCEWTHVYQQEHLVKRRGRPLTRLLPEEPYEKTGTQMLCALDIIRAISTTQAQRRRGGRLRSHSVTRFSLAHLGDILYIYSGYRTSGSRPRELSRLQPKRATDEV